MKNLFKIAGCLLFLIACKDDNAEEPSILSSPESPTTITNPEEASTTLASIPWAYDDTSGVSAVVSVEQLKGIMKDELGQNSFSKKEVKDYFVQQLEQELLTHDALGDVSTDNGERVEYIVVSTLVMWTISDLDSIKANGMYAAASESLTSNTVVRTYETLEQGDAYSEVYLITMEGDKEVFRDSYFSGFSNATDLSCSEGKSEAMATASWAASDQYGSGEASIACEQ